MTRPKLNARIATMKPVNSFARIGSSPNAWTDCTTPDRVMNVPKMVRKNVMMTSVTFQTRNMLRRSCTMTEWRNARSEEHTSELQSPYDLVCRLLLEKKKKAETE